MIELSETRQRVVRFIDLLKDSGGLLVEARVQEIPHQPVSSSVQGRPEMIIDFSGSDSTLLVRDDFELLKAIHWVAASMLRLGREEQERIWFDVNHLRADRMSQLKLMAEGAAARVRLTGASHHFHPMLSCERHMLHVALADLGLQSASVGEGDERCVVLYPEGTVSQVGLCCSAGETHGLHAA